MCSEWSMSREQNTSRWGNCEQMICVFARIAKCTPASIAIFVKSWACFWHPSPFLSSEVSQSWSPWSWSFTLKIWRGKKRQGLWRWPQSSPLRQSRRTRHAEASQHQDPMDAWSWKTGLSLEVPFHSFEFSCSLSASFSVIQGEGRHRGYFWADLWGSFAPPLTPVLAHIPSLRSALAVFEHCYDGGTCTGIKWGPACVVHLCVAQGVGCKGLVGGPFICCAPHTESPSAHALEASDKKCSEGLCWRKPLRKKLPVCLPFLTRCGDRRERKHQRFFQTDSDSNQFLPVG